MAEMADNNIDMSFAAQLQRLFDSYRREDGKRYTAKEVADEISYRGRVQVSKSYLYELLKGQKTSPSLTLVQALAEFFEVNLDYFADDERGRDLNRQYETVAALADADVRQIAQRARDLSPDQLRSVLQYVDFVRTTRDDADTDHPDI